jgi:hypothetical protein
MDAAADAIVDTGTSASDLTDDGADAIGDLAQPADGSETDAATDASRDLSAPGDAADAPMKGDAADAPVGSDAADAPVGSDAADAPVGSDAADGPSPADGALNARYVFKIPVLAEALVGDPVRRRLYASVGGASPQYPNTLLMIDANTGAVVESPYVGSNPRALALSDDSSVLWIGVDGALAICRLTLTTDPPGIGPMMALTQALGAGKTIGPMVGLPGVPLSVVASTTDGARTVVLDDGVARPTSASTLGRSASSMAAGAPGYVYGFNGQSTGFGLLTMTITAAGISDLSTTAGLVSGFGTQIIYRAGRVYANSGEVVDVSTPTHPVAGGRLPYVGTVALGKPSRLFILAGDAPDAGTGRPTQILAVDETTLQVVGRIPFPPDLFGVGFNIYGGASSLVYLGPDTVAFLVRLEDMNTLQQTGTIVVIRDPLIAAVN